MLKALSCNLPSGAWNSPHSVWCHAELRNRSTHCSSEGKKDTVKEEGKTDIKIFIPICCFFCPFKQGKTDGWTLEVLLFYSNISWCVVPFRMLRWKNYVCWINHPKIENYSPSYCSHLHGLVACLFTLRSSKLEKSLFVHRNRFGDI